MYHLFLQCVGPCNLFGNVWSVFVYNRLVSKRNTYVFEVSLFCFLPYKISIVILMNQPEYVIVVKCLAQENNERLMLVDIAKHAYFFLNVFSVWFISLWLRYGCTVSKTSSYHLGNIMYMSMCVTWGVSFWFLWHVLKIKITSRCWTLQICYYP